MSFAEEALLTTLKEFIARSDGIKSKKARVGRGEQAQMRCRQLSKTEHNARTCKEPSETALEQYTT